MENENYLQSSCPENVWKNPKRAFIVDFILVQNNMLFCKFFKHQNSFTYIWQEAVGQTATSVKVIIEEMFPASKHKFKVINWYINNFDTSFIHK